MSLVTKTEQIFLHNKSLYKMPPGLLCQSGLRLNRNSLVDTVLAYWTYGLSSKASSDFCNKTKYEKIFLRQLTQKIFGNTSECQEIILTNLSFVVDSML